MTEDERPARAGAEVTLRPLAAEDLEAVVALDRQGAGHARRGYFEKRLAAALRVPEAHVQVGAVVDGALVGFALGRVLEGEFGAGGAALILETIGVDEARRRRGIGRALLEGLEAVMRHKGIAELETQAAWSDHDLLRFLDAAGFALAPRHVLELPVGPGGG